MAASARSTCSKYGPTAEEECCARVKLDRLRAQTTVLMPSYNAEDTLRESVESVLAQTVGDLGLVAV